MIFDEESHTCVVWGFKKKWGHADRNISGA